MKNAIKTLGIIALVAIIGFSFVTCGNSEAGDGGDPPYIMDRINR